MSWGREIASMCQSRAGAWEDEGGTLSAFGLCLEECSSAQGSEGWSLALALALGSLQWKSGGSLSPKRPRLRGSHRIQHDWNMVPSWMMVYSGMTPGGKTVYVGR